LTLSVHWRKTPRRAQAEFHQMITQATSALRARGAVRLTRGKRVVEIRPPVAWGKAEMIRWFLRQHGWQHPARTPLIVYVGDDETDEGVFALVNRARGISIVVGAHARASTARWRLRHPRSVQALLRHLLEARCPTPRR